MRILEIHSNLIVVNINYILLPTRSDSRNTILCKMSAERIQHGRTRWTEQKRWSQTTTHIGRMPYEWKRKKDCNHAVNVKGLEREGIRKSWKNNTFMITSNDAQIYHSKLIYVSELAVKFKRLNTLYMNILIRILK